MASPLMRNIPLLLTTAGILLCLYVMWKHITRLEKLQKDTACALDQLSNEVYFTISGPNDKKIRVENDTENNIQPFIVAQSLDDFHNEEASSVASEDVVNDASLDDTLNRSSFHENDNGTRIEDDVNIYIGNLEDKFVANRDEDTESVMSGATISGVRKKSPPQSAASFPIGHQQLHNGKLFEVIKTKKNVIRWGKPTNTQRDNGEPVEKNVEISYTAADDLQKEQEI